MEFKEFIKRYGLENGGRIETSRFSLRKNKKGELELVKSNRENFSVEKRSTGYAFITEEIGKMKGK